MQVPSSPFATDTTGGAAVTDDKPAEERPGVGRNKAADLPHDGYSKPESTQKGCCGCVIM